MYSKSETPAIPFDWAAPVTHLIGVGEKLAQRLAKINIRCVQDLLFHLPLRYEDRTRVFPIDSLRSGMAAVICGEIQFAQVSYGRRRTLVVAISDGTGLMNLRFFHFQAAQQKALVRGVRIRCYGEVRNGPSGKEVVHPEYRVLKADAPVPVEATLTPVYPTTDGLGQLQFRKLIAQVVSRLGSHRVPDLLPAEVVDGMKFPILDEALLALHTPTPDIAVEALARPENPARRRLAFEEILAHHLSLRRVREALRADTAPTIQSSSGKRDTFLSSLPFSPTGAQSRVLEEIMQDLRGRSPMNRLVHGDVGSGKTLVAALAALAVIESGWQVALMAPTELLAEQHFKTLQDWLGPMGVRVACLLGRHSARERTQYLEDIASRQSQLVVGTHVLFQEKVRFPALGLVVIDEQHRFGVEQRKAIRDKGRGNGLTPHQLVMTATPIPRTLAMTAFADLDTSVIDELPPGRLPVDTVVVPDSRRDDVVSRVSGACATGRQVYWVCTLVEESEQLQSQAAQETAETLSESLCGVSVGLIHGRLKGDEKDAAMSAFQSGRIQVLVATTVIEVGVDVPNASLMIIENAERLGLAQIHQLRGRVGRGARKSACVLMYRGPLSSTARSRLEVLRGTDNGFEIAEQDLKMRGPGEVLGTRQAGQTQYKIANLLRDRDLLPHISRAAGIMLSRHPHDVVPLCRRWIDSQEDYGNV